MWAVFCLGGFASSPWFVFLLKALAVRCPGHFLCIVLGLVIRYQCGTVPVGEVEWVDVVFDIERQVYQEAC